MKKPTVILEAPEMPKVIDRPTIFLAGPIRGARDWQTEACNLLSKRTYGFYIANPRRKMFPEDCFKEQVDWETRMLHHAGFGGTILFWCCKEESPDWPLRTFGQTTRFELGEWFARATVDPDVRLSIGIEPGFPGEDYIRERISKACPDWTIYSDLDSTCLGAIIQTCGETTKFGQLV